MSIRLCPDIPLPPYSYVPGKFPHPIGDKRGHSFGRAEPPCPMPTEENWQECEPYLWGCDLFNHGYYWEAHEAWEAGWHACQRRGSLADFLKGLIKLAAAGVKAREGKSDGARRHLQRAAELLEGVERTIQPRRRVMGLEPAAMAVQAHELAAGTERLVNVADVPVAIVLPIELMPRR